MTTNWIEYFTSEMNKRGISDLDRKAEDDPEKIKGIPIVEPYEEIVFGKNDRVFFSESVTKRHKGKPKLLIWCDRILYGSRPEKELQEAFEFGFQTDFENGFINLVADIFGDNALIRTQDQFLERPDLDQLVRFDQARENMKEANMALNEDKPVSTKKLIDDAVDTYSRIRFYFAEREALKNGNPFDFYEDRDENWEDLGEDPENPFFWIKSAISIRRNKDLVSKTKNAIKYIRKTDKNVLGEAEKKRAVEDLIKEAEYSLEQITKMSEDGMELEEALEKDDFVRPKNLAEEIRAVEKEILGIPKGSSELTDYMGITNYTFASHLRRIAKHAWDIQNEKK